MSQKVNVVNLAARMAKMIPTENWPDTVNGYFEFESKFFSFLQSLESEDKLELIFQLFYKSKFDPETIKKNVKGARTIVLVENEGSEGREDCDMCDAEGRVSCDRCDGVGWFDCENCDSRGDVQCDECDGSGQDSEGEECEECAGGGSVVCSWCDGDGREDCGDCSGNGDLECDKCEGDGMEVKPEENMCIVTIAVSFDRDLNRKLLNYVGKVLPSELVAKVNKSFVVSNRLVSVNLGPKNEKFPEDENVLVAVLDDPYAVYETVLYIPTQRYPDEEIKATAENLIPQL